MAFRLRGLFGHALRIVLYGAVGAILALVVVFVIVMNNRPDLEVWHLANLDEEFTAGSKVSTFKDYLALEDRLFRQLDELVYDKVVPDPSNQVNRYSRGSLSDPGRWPRNWNRSYEMPLDSPRAAVLLLHGMSDSPYSLHNVAQRLHLAGAYVVGLRIPGHGTAPSGLLRVSVEDMAAAVRLAMSHTAAQADGRPVFIVGYSNGAALAVNYTLDAVRDSSLPRVDGLVLLSPEIGITKAAAFASWQARLGTLLGLDKLAWESLSPEYDPYKYGSFAVNAGDAAHRLTAEIQRKITDLGRENKLGGVPPILAFSSVVDATVSAPALVRGLFARLPGSGNELVLFDINRVAHLEPIMKWQPDEMLAALRAIPNRTFGLGLVTNREDTSLDVVYSRKAPGQDDIAQTELNLRWPAGVYSLSHVALPFPADDPLYGGPGHAQSPGIYLGEIALRGERGVLYVPAAEMLRMRWNPFFPFVAEKMLEFLHLKALPEAP